MPPRRTRTTKTPARTTPRTKPGKRKGKPTVSKSREAFANSAFSRLPVEIFDRVGGFLWDSRKTLRACTLTCRAWQRVLRPHIFRRIVLDSDSKLENFETLLAEEPIIGYWVTEIVTEGSKVKRKIGAFRSTSTHWLTRIPTLLPKYLKRLRTITILDIHDTYSWTLKQWEDIAGQFNAFTSVKELAFVGCYLTDYVVKIISHSLPSLEDLHFHNSSCHPSTVWVDGAIQTVTPSELKPVRLRSLRIHSHDGPRGAVSTALLPWFNRSEKLHDVQIHIDLPFDLVAVGSYIASLPASVHNLELAFPFKYSFTDIKDQCETIAASFDLGHLKELRSLHLRGMSHPAAVLHLVSSTKSPSLRSITIDISFMFLGNIRASDYDEHDVCLSGKQFKDVTEICFLYNGPLAPSRVTKKMEQVLPTLASRGVLRVVKNQQSRSMCLCA